MSLMILPKAAIAPFVEALMADYRVVGPKAKGPQFVFDVLEGSDELRLDYNTTILPPKKFLQPPEETILTFKGQPKPEVRAVVKAEPTVLFGVHSCDLHAIQLLDRAFADIYPDHHYLKRREATLIIGLECLNPCDEHAFCNSMGTMNAYRGFDLYLTDIGDGYVVEVATEEGEHLLNHYANGAVRMATEAEWHQVEELRRTKGERFPDRLEFSTADLALMLTRAYHHPIWEELGERCLACGSCTNVCPTCYCFDVLDEVDFSLTSGERRRRWDSCLLDDFARVAGGENFREARSERQRHRYMHKLKYLYERFGVPGCVGCGRCVRTCVAKIDIVETLNAIYRSVILEKEAEP